MDEETYRALAKARIERAADLVEEAEELLNQGRYKSANNRAFYAIEKSLRAMLSVKGIDAGSHNGTLRQFNNSDYDDFYVADKEECAEQVKTAKEVLEKAQAYLKSMQMG